MKCEMKGCDKYTGHKVGFAGFQVGCCNDHLDLMMDRSMEFTNKMNLKRLKYLRMIIGKIPVEVE